MSRTRRNLYLIDPLPNSELFAKTSDKVMINRSLIRNESGKNRYTVTLANGERIVNEFVWLPRFFDWLEELIGPFVINPHRMIESRVGHLSDEEKAKIIALREMGLTYKRIALETERSQSTISQFCRAWEKENGVKLKRAA